MWLAAARPSGRVETFEIGRSLTNFVIHGRSGSEADA